MMIRYSFVIPLSVTFVSSLLLLLLPHIFVVDSDCSTLILTFVVDCFDVVDVVVVDSCVDCC